ncbi:MAG TPA: DUF3857 domain-containing protein [Steroidobacteraceae bacterium]|nr:DUF3857 domain-containing protein [Steroidobacteraceae bacterium]
MRAQLGAQVPAHDAKANAVILYRETVLTVTPNGKIKRLNRQVTKILRPDGVDQAKPRFYYGPTNSITDVHGWSVTPDAKDYEVKERDAIDSADIDVEGGELVTDLRMKLLAIPGAQVGTVIGYEVEEELRPEFLSEDWEVQNIVPIGEERFTLILPAGWSYESRWLNHGIEAPRSLGPNQWVWVLNQVAPVKIEPFMPPWSGIAARMVLSMSPPGGKGSGISTWNDIGVWYGRLISDRRTPSASMKQKVAELTANAASPLAKIQAIAKFVQTDIRYVAIELGIGGHQPHLAADIFSHRYGDCKDNATLLSTMLKEIGVESYYVIINTERGAVSESTPPNLQFNHAILAIVLPAGEGADLPAQMLSSKWGRVLFFDPTDSLTPFGVLRGELQANFALLVGQDGGELVQLPQLSPELSGVTRTATMELDDQGTLKGKVNEVHRGGHAAQQRAQLRAAAIDTDRIKPIERLAGASLSNFQVIKASISNLHAEALPFEWHYTLEVANYSKTAGDLLLLRPRLLGNEAAGFLETASARVQAVEFDEPERDIDTVEIQLPVGYAVDELPPATNIEDGFASYHSKTEFSGRTLKYTRTLEIKELSVPPGRADELKLFYRKIAEDERNSAVLKRPKQ